MIIGKFTTGENGRLNGVIETFSGYIGVVLIPASSGADFNVVTDSGCEFGTAWKRTTAQGGKPYLSVRLDSPFLLQPVNCALFAKQDGSEHYLVWNREKPASGGH